MPSLVTAAGTELIVFGRPIIGGRMADLPYAKKGLGQHWLTDKTALESIASSVNISKNTTVLEVGPGAGTLTEILVKRAKAVIAVEFDNILAANLSTKLNNPSNLQVVHQDILNFDLTDLPKDYVVVANIPYYLTSKLIRDLCESSNPPRQAALLVQKEVAQRVAAGPGGMSLLSISAQVYNNVAVGELVPAHLFTPPPKVDSQVLILNRLPEPLVDNADLNEFFIVVKAGFSERRKKLRSSLSGGLRISKQQADELLTKANISPNVRAQELSITDWQKIANKSEIN